VFLLVAFALAVLWLRYAALPHIDDYRGRIFASIEKASGMAVSARRIEGGWEGLRPHLSLMGFEIADHAGRVAVGFERAEVTVSWWSLLRGRVRFHDVDFYRPLLELRRGLDGRLYLADQPLDRAEASGDDAFTQWLLSQPRLGIHDATLVWRDELAGAPEVRLEDVQISMRRSLGTHRAALSARPPASLASRLELRGDVRVQREGKRYTATGELYGETLDADLAGLRVYLPVPDTLKSGVGNVRVWARLGAQGIDEMVADLAVRDARAQLDNDAQPLEVAALSGRAVYETQEDGYSVATRNLRFRLHGADETFTGNFSIARHVAQGGAPRVEIGADAIDLKLVSTLLEYLPIPHDLRSQVVRFAPRGRLDDALFSWSGDDAAHAKTYALRGRFTGFGVNAVDHFPGVTGLTGRVEGTQAGGTLEIDSHKVGLDLPLVFRDPLAFDTLQAKGEWKSGPAGLALELKSLRFANADTAGEASGTWHARTHPDRSPGVVDLRGHLERLQGVRLPAYLPNRMAPARAWVERAVQSGEASNVRFELKGDLHDFPFAAGTNGRFLIDANVKGARLQYLADWPAIDGIDGTVRFENHRMEVHAERGTIFSSRIGATTAVIPELIGQPGNPARVKIDGDVDTTGADGTRFLRESPLVNGPGAFTRAVSIDGPAHLKLGLDIPLGPGGDPLHVAGDLRFAGDTARVNTNNLVMRDVRGRLTFTEKAVRAQDVAGVMFDEPTRLAIATQPDGSLATTLEGRIDAANLAPFVPAFVATHMQGAAAWRARLTTAGGVNDLAILSDLRGMAVSLPAPGAKDADSTRAVTVTLANLGTERETTRIALEGGIQGRAVRASNRWNAAFAFGEPLPDTLRDGLWLYGELDQGDADAWRALFPPAPADTAPQQAGMELNGLDLKLGHLRFLGRDIPGVHAVLERHQGIWQGRVDSPTLAGDVKWDPAGRGRVEARLEHLAIDEQAHPATPEVGRAPDKPASDLPAIDVVAQRFDFRGHWLGVLTLNAQPTGEEWRIDQLDIANDQSRFHSSGLWRAAGNGSLTRLAVKLESDNLNALFKQFGYGDYMRQGSAGLDGELVWNGLPHEFALANLAGTIRIDARHGQFAKIPTGAGKLLGLLSLQSLPRRAMFDFGDIFGEGFAFESIKGNVKIARGVMLTDAFEINGPAAFVSLSGEVSLPQETQVLTMRVVPEVSEGVAIAATVLGTPVLGLSTLVLSKLLKNPLGKAVSYEYRVTGSWDNPVVERISAPAARPGTSAQADAPAAAATNSQ
jgi:uncharacterized protein (TIGR02099 family)